MPEMVSIKHKIAKMIALADGELVCHRHAVEAGIFGADMKPNPSLKKQRQYPKNK
jgi:hypothetical protein